jgi:ketosteroid isomerase-like protein
MHRFAKVALVALALSLSGSAGPAIGRAHAQPTPAQDSVSRVLRQLEDDWCRALVKRDAAVFQRLLAPGFIYSEDDRTMDREAVLNDIVSGTDTVTAAHNEDMRVHRFGTTAVVTGWLVLQGRGAGGRFDRRYRYTDTWVSQSGTWRIVAAHDYLKPAGT